MSRVEENLDILNVMANDMKASGTFEEMVIWNLGAISSFMADISKSMAVIADNTTKIKDQTEVDGILIRR